MDFETVKRNHANIRRKIARCKESGDRKRLLGLREQLEHIRLDIDKIEPDFETSGEHGEARERQAVFRRSYRYEFFLEGLLVGMKLRRYTTKTDISLVGRQ